MSLRGGDELERAVAMLVVIPKPKAGHPCPSRQQAGKRRVRVARSVLQRLKQRLRIKDYRC